MATDAVAIRIRPATAAEAATLTDIAHEAKRHWGYPEEWIQLWREALTVLPEHIEQNHFYVAETPQPERFPELRNDPQTSAILGFVGCARDADHLEVGHLWIRPLAMGHAIGRRLWERAIDIAREQQRHRIELDSDPYATGFYERMGARVIGEVASTPEGRRLPHMRFDLAASSA